MYECLQNINVTLINSHSYIYSWQIFLYQIHHLLHCPSSSVLLCPKRQKATLSPQDIPQLGWFYGTKLITKIQYRLFWRKNFWTWIDMTHIKFFLSSFKKYAIRKWTVSSLNVMYPSRSILNDSTVSLRNNERLLYYSIDLVYPWSSPLQPDWDFTPGKQSALHLIRRNFEQTKSLDFSKVFFSHFWCRRCSYFGFSSTFVALVDNMLWGFLVCFLLSRLGLFSCSFCLYR